MLFLHRKLRENWIKKYEKLVTDGEINEIREELNTYEIESNLVNRVIPKPQKLCKSSGRNIHFMRPRYISAGRTTKFSFAFNPRKSFEEINLIPISQTGYILKIDGTRNR